MVRLIIVLFIIICVCFIIIINIKLAKKLFSTLKEGDYLLYSYRQYDSYESCSKVVQVVSVYPDRICVNLTPFTSGSMTWETITLRSLVFATFSGIELEKIDNLNSGEHYELCKNN